MKAVIQRVSRAIVAVDGHVVGEIEQGMLIYLGVGSADGSDQVAWLVDKIANLRIFDDPAGVKTTLSIKDIGGAALVISQFTLLADATKGRRPSFTPAAAPEKASALYDTFVDALGLRVPVQSGRFGADMQVTSVNEGPFTLVLEHPPPERSQQAGQA
jgi:D-tyrosyl-tRNA(Tyr) deacylase